MPATINDTVSVYQGRTFEVVRENITLPNGTTADTDVIRHPGAAAIVPFLDRTKMVLIRQYRHAIGDHIWEIPAGTLRPGESAAECARRELTEETGYSSQRWHTLGEIFPVPGYSDERITIFLATNLFQSTQALDEDEILRVHAVETDEVLSMIHRGTIQDGKTICGIYMTMTWLGNT